MSLDRFKQILDPAADRSERIAILASETDIATGIVDNVTDVSKAYFESEGPSDDTGTIYAAVCDIMDMLHGRSTGETLSMGGLLQMNAAGQVGIGGAPSPEPTVSNILHGRTWIVDGDLGLGDGLAVDGTALLSNTSLNTADGEWVQFGYLDLDVVERLIPSQIGNTLDLLEYDDAANLVLHLNGVAADAATIISDNGGQAALDAVVPMNFQVESEEFGKIFSLTRSGLLQLGPRPMDFGDYYGTWEGASIFSTQYLCLYTDSLLNGPRGLFMYTPRLSGDDQAIMMIGGDSGVYSGWRIVNEYTLPGDSGVLTFNFSDDMAFWNKIFEISKDSVSVVCDQDSDGYFRVWAEDDDDYAVYISTKLTAISNRHIAGTVITPGIILGGGGAGMRGRLGFDAWHTNNTLRLWVEETSDVQAVALGVPYGTRTAPVDALIVMEEPYGAGVGMDHLWMTANHPSKDGFHVGAGQVENGMIWLWADTGHMPGIHLGAHDTDNPILLGNEDGSLRTLPGTTLAANVGVSKSDHVIPMIETTYDFDGTDDAEIAVQIGNAVGLNYVGSSVVMVNRTNTEAQMWIRGMDGADPTFYKFTAIGYYTP